MAYSLIGTAIQTLTPLLREEYATFKGVKKHAKKLHSKLILIQALLKDDEESQIKKSHVAEVWQEKVTDVVHILDDILDEYSIVSEANRDNASIFRPEMILTRRSIGKKMKKVVKKVNDIHQEGQEIKAIKAALGIIPRHHEDGKRPQTSYATVINGSPPIGRDEDKEKVVRFLVDDARNREEPSVYSIVGDGGYGKTTLAQLVYNDERVTTHFPLKIWVCVSDNDFNMEKILKSIIEIKSTREFKSLSAMQECVEKILQNKRYLLVLDNVWNEDETKWNEFKSFLQHVKNTTGASVLVTTRLMTVASTMKTVGLSQAAQEFPTTDDTSIHRLLRLSDDNIRYLFKQNAFKDNREWPKHLVTIGEDLVKKCVGSPLAAIVLGRLLKDKTDELTWLDIMESEIWNISDDSIISALTLSYSYLELSLRPCFTFCAVFPKNFVMVKQDLIHLWMANGFISSRRKLEMEHVGDMVWNELYQRSFFQEVETDEEGKVTFKMHDIFHDIASSVMREQCLVSKAASLPNLPQRVRHVSCFNIDEQFKYNLIPKKNVKFLRTFLGFYPSKSNLGAFPSTTPLRALSTSSYQLSALKNLIHLRYLKLYRSDIKTLPQSICCLRKLQTLKLELCEHLSSLPKQLTQLKDLRHLVIKGCLSLASMPSRIGVLTNLRTLSIYIVGSEVGFGLGELHGLQLGGQLHIKGLENVSNEEDAKEASLVSKKELSRLYLSWDSDENSQHSGIGTTQVSEAIQPHRDANSQGSGARVERVLEAFQPHTNEISQGSGTGAEIVPEALQRHIEAVSQGSGTGAEIVPEALQSHKDASSQGSGTGTEIVPEALQSYTDAILQGSGAGAEIVPEALQSYTDAISQGSGTGAEIVPEAFQPHIDTISHGSGTGAEIVPEALPPHKDNISQGSGTHIEIVPEALRPHRDANSQGSGTGAEQVLEALQPHPGLKYFGMKGYTGTNIPNWMTNVSILEGLVNVVLYNCKNCKRLPPLGKLPCLTTLYVSGMRDVKYIDDDLYELGNEKAFSSLKEMTLYDLPNLERVLMTEGVEMLSQLSKLSIQGIPKLALPVLPSVENVYVNGETTELSESIDDGASFLRRIAGSMTNIKELMIEEFGYLVVLPKKFKSLCFLQELYISCCGNLESIPKEVFAGLSSLRVLSFAFCNSLNSLPKSTTNLTSLQRLQITFCSNLILPATMNMLTSLRVVRIFGQDINGGLHKGIERIPSLQKLYLTSFPSVEALPNWLGGMTSLQTLEISGFPRLTSLPANFQQLVNLQKLRISKSPVLANRLKKTTGDDWQKNLKLELESDVKPTTSEKIMSSWKTLKQCWRPHQDYYPIEDEFDGMFDEQ